MVSSVTLYTRRDATGCGASSLSRGSSSNGRSKRSLIGRELGELIVAETETFDARREPGLLVRIDDDGVQAGICNRRFEPCGERVQEFSERRLDFDTDDGIVRPRHPHVCEEGRPLRENALVSGLYMGVCADDGRHFAVEMPAHRGLF